jgi:hypothetical protein
LGQDGSEIVVHRKIPSFVQIAIFQAFPTAVPASTLYLATHDPQSIAMAVVCAAGTVFGAGAAKLAAHHDDITGLREVSAKLYQGSCQIA